MKKLIKIVVVLVLLLVIGGGLFLIFGLNAAVKAGVEKGGSHVLKTEVSLAQVKLSPWSGKGTLEGLLVKNPEGFSEGNAFELGKVHVDIKPSSVMSDKVVLREVIIDGPVITYDRELSKSNIGQLKKNIEELAGPKEEKPEEPEPEKEDKGEGKQVALEHFVLQNGEVRITSKLLKGEGVTLQLPKIELNDIGTGNKTASVAEVINKVYAAVAAAVVKAIEESDISIEGGVDALKEMAADAGDLDKILESMDGDDMKKTTDSVKEGLKGILGGAEE